MGEGEGKEYWKENGKNIRMKNMRNKRYCKMKEREEERNK